MLFLTIYKSLIVLSVTTGSISIASSFLLGLIFFSPGDTYTRRMFFLLHLGLEGVTEVDTDPRDRFVSFKVTTSNESSVYAPSGYSTIEQLAKWYFFEGLEKYMQNKNEGNENKIMLGDLNCTMDKIGNFNNSLSCKPEVSAATRTFHFLLKTEK